MGPDAVSCSYDTRTTSRPCRRSWALRRVVGNRCWVFSEAARVYARDSRECLGPTRLAPVNLTPFFSTGGRGYNQRKVTRFSPLPVSTSKASSFLHRLHHNTRSFPQVSGVIFISRPWPQIGQGMKMPSAVFLHPTKIFPMQNSFSTTSHTCALACGISSCKEDITLHAFFMAPILFSLSCVLKLYRVTSQKQGPSPVPFFC